MPEIPLVTIDCPDRSDPRWLQTRGGELFVGDGAMEVWDRKHRQSHLLTFERPPAGDVTQDLVGRRFITPHAMCADNGERMPLLLTVDRIVPPYHLHAAETRASFIVDSCRLEIP